MLVHVFLPQTRYDLVDHPIIDDLSDPKVRLCFDSCTWTWAPGIEAHEGAKHTLGTKEGMVANTIEGRVEEGEVVVVMSHNAKVRIKAKVQPLDLVRYHFLEKWDSRDQGWVPYLNVIEALR